MPEFSLFFIFYLACSLVPVEIVWRIYNPRRPSLNENGPTDLKHKNNTSFPIMHHVFQRMFTGSEHLPHSLLPTLMLAKMVVRA